MVKINDTSKSLIFHLKSLNKTWKEISEVVQHPIDTIRSFYRRSMERSKYPERPKLGGKLISARIGLLIKRKLHEDPRISIRKLLNWLKTDHQWGGGSRATLHRYLMVNGYSNQVARKKFALSERNRQKSLFHAREFVGRDEAYFERVVWSDETHIKSRPDHLRITYYARPSDPEIINPQVKGGGISVGFWGCLSAHGFGPLEAYRGTLNSESYIRSYKSRSYR